jgi:AcrR family transcriptional regulator
MPQRDVVERRRREILEAAGKVLAAKGYQGTNVADIAQELGIGHGTFYRYFENKRHIAESVLQLALDQVAQLVSDVDPEAAGTLGEYDEQLVTLGNRLFDFFLGNRDLAEVFFFESYGVDKALTGCLLEALELFGEYVERYLRNGCSKGFLRADIDVEITARAINGMIFAGALRTLRTTDPESQRDRWIDAIRRLMLTGMAARTVEDDRG